MAGAETGEGGGVRWHVYVLKEDGMVFYVGCTTNPKCRAQRQVKEGGRDG